MLHANLMGLKIFYFIFLKNRLFGHTALLLQGDDISNRFLAIEVAEKSL